MSEGRDAKMVSRSAVAAIALMGVMAGCAAFEDLSPRDLSVGELVSENETPGPAAGAVDAAGGAVTDLGVLAENRPTGPGAEPILDGDAGPRPAQAARTAAPSPAQPETPRTAAVPVSEPPEASAPPPPPTIAAAARTVPEQTA
ncbi:MAG: hypothetical protein AAF909_03080, partial [Pseudomonadota bacterium]